MRASRQRQTCLDRANVHDRAAAALSNHLPCSGLSAQPLTFQIDPRDALPFGFGQVEQWHDRLHAGVVHQDIQAAERLDRPVDQALHVTSLGHVTHEHDRPHPAFVDQARHLMC